MGCTRTLGVVSLALAVQFSWTAWADEPVITSYSGQAAFLDAIGTPLIVEGFDAFPDGTVITTQVPGVVFSSPNESLEGYIPITASSLASAPSPPNILSGGFQHGSPGVRQVIVMDFTPGVLAIGFTLSSQTPDSAAVTLELEFLTGATATMSLREGFNGLVSDTRISRAKMSSDKPSGQDGFQKFGFDDLILGTQPDLDPPICSGDPVLVEGTLRVDGLATDNRSTDTGIASVALADGAVNATLVVDLFEPGAPAVGFRLTPTVATEEGDATVVASDLAGNTCGLPIGFCAVQPGPTEDKVLCAGNGIVLLVSNEVSSPGGPCICVSSLPGPGDPSYPPGYEVSPPEDPTPCRVLTIDSPISGLTEMVYKKDGTFDPSLRLLFSRFDGVEFPPFTDITEQVTEIADVIPDPTRIKGTGGWSQIKVTCAILSEICNGLDDDGDGSIDEGLPVGDPSVDADGDTYALCPVDLAQADCNDQIAAINPGASETCNGLDDDCDGTADDGNPDSVPCVVPDLLGACAASATTCVNSLLVCEQSVFPVPETCNSVDDDCDGTTDEGFVLGQPCTVGVGQCQASGSTVCSTDGSGTVCSVAPGTPSAEICDGLDNDCDGATDEGGIFSGYLQPVNADGTSIFNLKSVIPFKFRLATCSGADVSNAVATIQVFFYANGIVGSELENVGSAGKANTDGLYRFDSKAKNYIYNLGTKTLSPNTSYLVRTTINGTSQHDVVISIK